MTTSYERAGLTPAEVEHLSNLVSSALSADPSIPWIAVRRADVLSVVATLDRLADGAATSTADTADRQVRSGSGKGSDRGDDPS